MTNIDTYRYFSDITLEEFEEKNVLLFKSEDGRPCILIKNSKPKTVTTKGVTDNLEYHLNTVVSKDFNNYYVHIIVCAKTDSYSKDQFEIAYNYLFKKISEPQSDSDLNKLIASLEQLFKVTTQGEKAMVQIGVYGELLFLLYIYNKGYKKILEKYHSSFYSKHDIEINDKNRIEIKTSSTPVRIHKFRHDQIFRDDVNVFVGSVLIEQSKEGLDLFSLFNIIIGLIVSPEQLLDIGKLRGICGISEDSKGPSFAYEKAMSQIRIFEANKLPHLTVGPVNGVSNISYDVDCELAEPFQIEHFIELLNSLG